MGLLPDTKLKTQTDTRLPWHGLCALRGLSVQGEELDFSRLILTAGRHGGTMMTQNKRLSAWEDQRLTEEAILGLHLEERKDLDMVQV